jgi:uncharacterized protein RhaS with RHS repeats
MSYDPTIGRWTAEDPIAFEGGDANLYRYVGNNPTNFTDPTGLSVWIDIETYHVDITIPRYDSCGNIIGYTNFSYGATTGNVFGGPGKVIVTDHGPDWDPNKHHDYRIDTTNDQDKQMLDRARYYVDNPPNYNLLFNNTCVGVTSDILDYGGIDGPWYVPDPASGYGFDDWLEDWIDGVHKLHDIDDESGGSSGSSGSSSNDGGSSGRGGSSSS